MKVKVIIEEHLVREVEYEYPDGTDIDTAMEDAEKKTEQAYKNEEIVLDASDHTGTLHSVEVTDSNGNYITSTEYKEW